MNVITRITAGQSILSMDAGIPTGSGLQTHAWIWWLMGTVQKERFFHVFEDISSISVLFSLGTVLFWEKNCSFSVKEAHGTVIFLYRTVLFSYRTVAFWYRTIPFSHGTVRFSQRTVLFSHRIVLFTHGTTFLKTEQFFNPSLCGFKPVDLGYWSQPPTQRTTMECYYASNCHRACKWCVTPAPVRSEQTRPYTSADS